MIRVGGNTQDLASVNITQVQEIVKQPGPPGSVTVTPQTSVGLSLFVTLQQFHLRLYGTVHWIWGLALEESDYSPPTLMASYVNQALKGDVFLYQPGNEPDLYANHLRRPSTYSVANYFTEFQNEINSLINPTSGAELPNSNIFGGPTTCCTAGWDILSIINAGYFTQFGNYLKAAVVQHYPQDNCNGQGGTLGLDYYQNHQNTVAFSSQDNAAIVQTVAANKYFIMGETNTASCSGIRGISDVYAAAMWGVDYSLQLAVQNHSAALYHVGGQGALYNPFTPANASESGPLGTWTIGPIYYSVLVLSEVFGSYNNTIIADLGFPTPQQVGYVAYEDNAPQRVVLINYSNDTSSFGTWNAGLSFATGTGPSSITVRSLTAPSAQEPTQITYAGQTMAGTPDGQLQGDRSDQTISCGTDACNVEVPALSIQVIFLNDRALNLSTPNPEAVFYSQASLLASFANQNANGTVNGTKSGAEGASSRISGLGLVACLIACYYTLM